MSAPKCPGCYVAGFTGLILSEDVLLSEVNTARQASGRQLQSVNDEKTHKWAWKRLTSWLNLSLTHSSVQGIGQCQLSMMAGSPYSFFSRFFAFFWPLKAVQRLAWLVKSTAIFIDVILVGKQWDFLTGIGEVDGQIIASVLVPWHLRKLIFPRMLVFRIKGS